MTKKRKDMKPRDYTRLTQIEARGNRQWAIGKDEIASHNYKQGEALAMTLLFGIENANCRRCEQPFFRVIARLPQVAVAISQVGWGFWSAEACLCVVPIAYNPLPLAPYFCEILWLIEFTEGRRLNV